MARVVRNYVKKGNALYIEGTPKYGTYQAKDGETKIKIEVNISKLILLGDKQETSPTNGGYDNPTNMNGRYPLSRDAGVIAGGKHPDEIELDDELPF